MKKILALLLAISILLTFSACTKKTESERNAENEETENVENSAGEKSPNQNSAISFTELLVVDNDDCLIKITGIDPDNWMGYAIKVELENRSTDKNYMFSIDEASINGVATSALLASEVAAGKKANDDITFFGDEEELALIGDFTDIELTFRVYNSEDWMADDIYNGTVHIYPYGEENATKYVRQAQPEDEILFDNDDITVIVTGYEWDDIWGYKANVYIVNKTEKNLMFSVENASLNGYMVDPYFAVSVSGGKSAFESITWSSDTLDENNITDIEEIEFTMSVSDWDDWMADDIANETFMLNP